MSDEPTFEQMSQALMAYLNNDNRAAVLAYARVPGGAPWAQTAEVTAIDAEGLDVAVSDGRGAEAPPAYLQPYLGEAVSVGAFSEPSPEAILNLNPDLILIGGLFPALEEMLPAFQEIAPVYVTFNSGDDRRAAFLGAADALNQTAAAEAWLADYDAACCPASR